MKKLAISIKHIIVLGGFVVLGFQMKAQEFTLKQACDYAIEHQYEAVNAGLDIDKSKKKIWETTAIGLPQVNGSLTYRNALDLEFDFPAAALNQPGNEFLSVFAADNISQGKLEATQLIFDGTYIVGLQAARTYLKLSQDQKVQTDNSVKANVVSTYYLALVAQENIDVLSGSMDNITKSIQETEALVLQGFLEETELDQLQLMYSNMVSTLNSAKQNKEVAYKMLKLNMGLQIDQEITLKDSLAGILNEISIESLAAQNFDLANNPDLTILETQRELLHLDLKRYRMERLPSIAAFYSYQNTAYQLDFDWYKDATWFDAQNVGVALNVPIWSSGMQGAKISQAKIELDKMDNALSYYNQALTIQYLNAKNDLVVKSENLSNAKKSMEIAEKIYNRTSIKHKEGMASSFELTQNKNQLLQAQGSYISALFELLNAKASIDKLQNKL